METVKIHAEEDEPTVQRTFTVQIPKRISDFLTDFAIWVHVPVDKILEDLLSTVDILKPFREDPEFIERWTSEAVENRIEGGKK